MRPAWRIGIARCRVEPEHGQALGEMRRQFGGDVDLAAAGRVDPDPARVEVKLAADPAGEERLRSAIFGVADDRVAERRHMRAQLVGAAGQRLKLEPGGAVAGAFDQAPAGLGRKPRFLVDVHLFAAGAGLFGQRRVDHPLRPTGTPTTSAQ